MERLGDARDIAIFNQLERRERLAAAKERVVEAARAERHWHNAEPEAACDGCRLCKAVEQLEVLEREGKG